MITATHLRNGTRALAACGILCSLIFCVFGPFSSDHSGRYRFPSEFFLADVLPYIAVAFAGALPGTRALAGLAFVAAIPVLALGAYAYIDYLRVPFINDIGLTTGPLQWMFAAAAVLLGFLGFIARRIQNPPDNPNRAMSTNEKIAD